MENAVITSPQQLIDAFIQITTEKHDELVKLWFQSPLYTGFIRGVVLPRTAERLGLLSWPKEYFYLDSIFYREKDTDHFPEYFTTAKYIDVAIEHENVVSGTAQEMNKLQLFNAPLKVLITYNKSESQRTEFLKIYEAIIRSADIFGDISSLRRQLVIFGRKPNAEIDWSAYLYEREGFVSLPYNA